MAIYHMSIKIGSKSKGQSAIAASAYRAGEKLIDKETGLTSDYTRKGGVVFSEISLCENAPAEYADRSTLWNAVHQIEKNKNAQLWREFEVALPQELIREEQIATVRDFVKGLTKQGMCVDWALHDKGDGNPHAHIMTTMRSITPDGKWAAKSRKVYDLDESGERIFQKVDKSGRKQYKSHKEDYNNWNAAERVEEWRAKWADCCNARLTECDHIDHRSYARQGIDQIPTIHEGYAARQLTAKGLPSERVQFNEEIRHKNTLLQRIAAQLKAIGEEIKHLITEQKGNVINAGKQRIADLLARRSRAVDSDDRGLADGERATEGRIKRAEPTDTTAIFRAADSLIQDTDTNQEAVRAATANTDTLIRKSETTVESAAAHRQERELAEQRRAAEESQRIAEQLERERKELAERSKKKSGKGFIL